jgi:serine/threonine protein kinase
MVMEFIEGKNLALLLADKGHFESREALNLIYQIGEGLAAAHDKGVVHRDVKPENIIVSPGKDKDWVEIVDFGLAISGSDNRAPERLTSPGFVVGTQRYMAPEQMEGEPCTPSSDLFAFGLICAEMLGGSGSIHAGRLRRSVYIRSPLAPYWAIVEKACHDEPSQRWTDIRAMLHAFREAEKTTYLETERKNQVKTRPFLQYSKGNSWERWFLLTLTTLSITVSIFVIVNNFRANAAAGVAKIPLVTIHGVEIAWESKDALKITVAGNANHAKLQRLLLEVALCDDLGNRIPSTESALMDRALGSLQVVDIMQSPEYFKKVFRLRIPASVPKGYATATFFDSNQMILAHQNSGFWNQRP